MPNVFIYTRVSSEMQIKRHAREDDSLDVQRHRCQLWYKIEREYGRLSAEYSLVERLYEDSAVSGSKPLFERPAGHRMIGQMRKGDIVVCSSFDRLFRNTMDALRVDEAFRAFGAAFVPLDIPHLDTRTPVGQFILTAMAGLKQYDRAETGRKTAEACKSRYERMIPYGSAVPVGWKRVDVVTSDVGGLPEMLVPNHAWRWQCRILRQMRDTMGVSRDSLSLWLNQMKIGRIGARTNNGKWAHHWIDRYVHAARLGFPCQQLHPFGHFFRLNPERVPSYCHTFRGQPRKLRGSSAYETSGPDKDLLSLLGCAALQPPDAGGYPLPA